MSAQRRLQALRVPAWLHGPSIYGIDSTSNFATRIIGATLHHDIDVGIASRRASRMAAHELHRSYIVAGFRKGHDAPKKPLDVLGKVNAHEHIIPL